MAHSSAAVSLAVWSIILFFFLLGHSVYLYISPGLIVDGIYTQPWWPSAVTSVGVILGAVWYASIAKHVEFVRSSGHKSPGMSLWAISGLVICGALFSTVMQDTFDLHTNLVKLEDTRTQDMDIDKTVNLPIDSRREEDYSTLPGHIYRIARLAGFNAMRNDHYSRYPPIIDFPLGEAIYTSARTNGVGLLNPHTEPQISSEGNLWREEVRRRGTRINATCVDSSEKWDTIIDSVKVSHPNRRAWGDSWNFRLLSPPTNENDSISHIVEPMILERYKTWAASGRSAISTSVARMETNKKGPPEHTMLLWHSIWVRSKKPSWPRAKFNAVQCQYSAFDTSVETLYTTRNPRGTTQPPQHTVQLLEENKVPADHPIMREAAAEVQNALGGWDVSRANRWALNGPLADGLNAARAALDQYYVDIGVPGTVRPWQHVKVDEMLAEIMESSLEAYFSLRRVALMKRQPSARVPLERSRWVEMPSAGGQGLWSVLTIGFMTLGSLVNGLLLLLYLYSENAAMGLDESYAAAGRRWKRVLNSSPGELWRWWTGSCCCGGGWDGEEEEEEQGMSLLGENCEADDDDDSVERDILGGRVRREDDGREPDYTLPVYEEGVGHQPPSYEDVVGPAEQGRMASRPTMPTTEATVADRGDGT